MSLEDKVLKQYEDRVAAWMKSADREDTIHVTSLVYGCARKVWYERKKVREFNLQDDIEGMFRMWIGTKLHETPLSDMHEYYLSSYIYGNKVTGTIDEIFEIDGMKILIDKKFVSKEPKDINEHYLKQISIYAVLLNDVKGIRVDKIGILYSRPLVDYYNKNRNKVFLVDVTDQLLEDTRNELYKLIEDISTGLATDTLPAKHESWYCRYCAFKDLCDNNQKGV